MARTSTKLQEMTFLQISIFAVEWHHCECCTLWPWPSFSRRNISNVNILKMVRASANVQNMTFVDFNICYRMASLRMLYYLTLTYFFKVNRLHVNTFSRKVTYLRMTHKVCDHDWISTEYRTVTPANIEIIQHGGWFRTGYGQPAMTVAI